MNGLSAKSSDVKKRLDITMSVKVAAAINHILEDLRSRSPVDSGEFKRGWNVYKFRVGTHGIRFMITNNATDYGIFLDTGASPGGEPWYWPQSGTSGTVSKSGKLKIENGRVWAGGLSPEGFAVGGIIDPVLFDGSARAEGNQNMIVDAIAEAIFEMI